jgi:hypothetical protein
VQIHSVLSLGGLRRRGIELCSSILQVIMVTLTPLCLLSSGKEAMV